MVLMLCGGLCPARAQSTAPVLVAPATLISPLLQQDGTAVFRLAMPNAAKVELHLEGVKDPFPMTKAPDGAWSVTVPKLAPQYYSYSFNVDGTDVLDPHNVDVQDQFLREREYFPGSRSTAPMPWEAANVPHGVVHHHYYHSNIVGINSEYYVYTPPGFDPGSKQKYPVLYLLHGYSDDPSAWTAWARPT